MMTTQPTRSLVHPTKPHRYTPSFHTNVARTWRKFRLLALLQKGTP